MEMCYEKTNSKSIIDISNNKTRKNTSSSSTSLLYRKNSKIKNCSSINLREIRDKKLHNKKSIETLKNKIINIKYLDLENQQKIKTYKQDEEREKKIQNSKRLLKEQLKKIKNKEIKNLEIRKEKIKINKINTERSVHNSLEKKIKQNKLIIEKNKINKQINHLIIFEYNKQIYYENLLKCNQVKNNNFYKKIEVNKIKKIKSEKFLNNIENDISIENKDNINLENELSKLKNIEIDVISKYKKILIKRKLFQKKRENSLSLTNFSTVKELKNEFCKKYQHKKSKSIFSSSNFLTNNQSKRSLISFEDRENSLPRYMRQTTSSKGKRRDINQDEDYNNSLYNNIHKIKVYKKNNSIYK
jgi:hypothetical protein